LKIDTFHNKKDLTRGNLVWTDVVKNEHNTHIDEITMKIMRNTDKLVL